jgi:transmembrane sensor
MRSAAKRRKLARLLQKYERGIATPEEIAFLQAYDEQFDTRPSVGETLSGPELEETRIRLLEKVDRRIAQGEAAPVIPMRTRLLRRVAVAAAVLLLAGSGAWWLTRSRRTWVVPVAGMTKPADIAAPARSRATLTLSSGQQVALDSAASGALATQGGAEIVKGAGGQLAYQLKVEHPVELFYNTLTNPRGSQVLTVTLSDGTKVWLNAESSIRYPAVFVGGDRSVEMTGEAYFEVKTNASQPFKVTVKGKAEVDVLGTSFNINAYDDENSIKTTLLKGSVRVAATPIPNVGVNTNNPKRSVVLKPGEQAQVVGGKMEMLPYIDFDQVMAWKNGLFNFDHVGLGELMRQISRWYDVEVTYEGGKVPDLRFGGEIGRDLNLSQVLAGLEQAHVHFRIEGKKLIVMP